MELSTSNEWLDRDSASTGDHAIGTCAGDAFGEDTPPPHDRPMPRSMLNSSGATPYSPFSPNVNDLICEALLILAPRAREGVKFECDLNGGRLATSTDPEEVFWLIYYVLRKHLKSMNSKDCAPTEKVLRIRSERSGGGILLKFQRSLMGELRACPSAFDGAGASFFAGEDTALKQAMKVVEHYGGLVSLQAAQGGSEAWASVTVKLPCRRLDYA